MARTHWPARTVREVLELVASGHTDRAISELTGIPTATVRTFRRRPPRRRLDVAPDACRLCDGLHDFEALDPNVYAYLLGAYLGDGWLGGVAPHHQLKIACDVRYPKIIDEVATAVEAIRGRRRI